jgi:hypothetical protein
MYEGNLNDLLSGLSERVELLLRQHGTLDMKNGDYWMYGIDLTIPSVDVLVFQTINLTPDLVSDCAGLLDNIPKIFDCDLSKVAKMENHWCRWEVSSSIAMAASQSSWDLRAYRKRHSYTVREGPLRVDSCLSGPLLDFQPGNLLCLAERPGSARSRPWTQAAIASLQLMRKDRLETVGAVRVRKK